MEATSVFNNANATLARVHDEYYKKTLKRATDISRVRTTEAGGNSGSLSVSVPSPGITAAGLHFNQVIVFSDGPLEDAAIDSMNASSENLELSGGMALYDVEQPGNNTLLRDSAFNPSVIYGKGIKGDTGSGVRYSEWSYDNVKTESAFKRGQTTLTQFSGKITLAGEDFALWTPNGRWGDSKKRGKAASELNYIPEARVVAIPWIQTTNDVHSFIKPSFDFGSEEAIAKLGALHDKIVNKVTDDYTEDTENGYKLRHEYNKTLGPERDSTSINSDVFSPDKRKQRSARKLFEQDDLSLFGYTASVSNALTTKDSFILERFHTEDASARRVDLEKRVYSSCTTPFVGKISSYLPKKISDFLSEGEIGMTLVVDPLILTLPSWIRPQDNGHLTGLTDNGQYISIKSPSVADAYAVPTAIRTDYLDLPNVNYELSIRFRPENLSDSVPEGFATFKEPLYYTIFFSRIKQATVNELILGDEKLAKVHLSANNAGIKVLGVSPTRTDDVLDTGIYNRGLGFVVKPLIIKETQRHLDMNDLKSSTEFVDGNISQSQPQGSILFLQAVNSLIQHVAGSNLDLSIDGEILNSGSSRPVYADTCSINYEGANSFYTDLKLQNGKSVSSSLDGITIRLALDTTIPVEHPKTLTKDTRRFMEVLSALCATEVGISHTRTSMSEGSMDNPRAIKNDVTVGKFNPTDKTRMADMFRENHTTSVEAVALMAYLVQQTHEYSMLEGTFDPPLSMEGRLEWIERVRSWCDPAAANTGGMSVFLSRYIEMGGGFARNVLFPLLADYYAGEILRRFKTWVRTTKVPKDQWDSPSALSLGHKYHFLDIIRSPRSSLTENVLPVRVQSNTIDIFVGSTSTDLINARRDTDYMAYVKGDMSLNVPRALMGSSDIPIGQRLSSFPGFGRTAKGSETTPYSTFEQYMNPFGFASLHGTSSFMKGLSDDVTDTERLQRAFLFSDIGNAVSMVLDLNLLSAFFVPVGQTSDTFIEFVGTPILDWDGDISPSLSSSYRMTIALDPTKEPGVAEAIGKMKERIVSKWKTLMKTDLAPSRTPSTEARSNWVATFFDDNGFSLKKNKGDGDCFFFAIQSALELSGKGTISVKELRRAVADSTTEDMFKTYKELSDSPEGSLWATNFAFMKPLRNLAALQEHMKTCAFWANGQTIPLMERIYNIKVIVVSKDDNAINCTYKMSGPFEPEHYVIVSLKDSRSRNSHYELVLFEERGVFTYDQIPAAVRDAIMNTCMGTEGAYDIIPTFSREYNDLAKAALTDILVGPTGLPIRVHTSLFVPAPLHSSHVSPLPEDENDAFAILDTQVSRFHKEKYTIGSLRLIETRRDTRYYISFVPAIPLLRESENTIAITTTQAVRLMEMVNDPTHEAPSVVFFIVPEVLPLDGDSQAILSSTGFERKEDILQRINMFASGYGALSLERKVSRGMGTTPTSRVSIIHSMDKRTMMGIQGHVSSISKGEHVVDMFPVWRQMHAGGGGSWNEARDGNYLGYTLDPMNRMKGNPRIRPVVPTGPHRAPVLPPRDPAPKIPPRAPTPVPKTPPRAPKKSPVVKRKENVTILSDAPSANNVKETLGDIKELINVADEAVKDRNLGEKESLTQALDDLRKARNDALFKFMILDYIQEYKNYEKGVEADLPRGEIDSAARKVNNLWQPRADPLGRFASTLKFLYENIEDFQHTLEKELESQPPVIAPKPGPPIPPEPRKVVVDLDPNSLSIAQIKALQDSAVNVRLQFDSMAVVMTKEANERFKNEITRIRESVTESNTRPMQAYMNAREEYERTEVRSGELTRNLNSKWDDAENSISRIEKANNQGLRFLPGLTAVENINYPEQMSAHQFRALTFAIAEIGPKLEEIIKEATKKDMKDIVRQTKDFETKFKAQLEKSNWQNAAFDYITAVEKFGDELDNVGTDLFSSSEFETAFKDIHDIWNESLSSLELIISQMDEGQKKMGSLEKDLETAKASADKEARENLDTQIQDFGPMVEDLAKDGELDANDRTTIEEAALDINTAIADTESSIQELENEADSAGAAAKDSEAKVANISDKLILNDVVEEAMREATITTKKLFEGGKLTNAERARYLTLGELIAWEEKHGPLAGDALELSDEISIRLGERPGIFEQGVDTQTSQEASDFVNIMDEIKDAQDASADAEALKILKEKAEEVARALSLSLAHADAQLENERIQAEEKARKEKHRATKLRKDAEAKLKILVENEKKAADAVARLKDSFNIPGLGEFLSGMFATPPASPVSTPPMSPRGLGPIDDTFVVGANRETVMIPSTTMSKTILMEPSLSKRFAPVISTMEQMTRVQVGTPRIIGYGNPALPLGLSIHVLSSDDLNFTYEEDIIFPIMTPLGFYTGPRRDIRQITLSCVSAIFHGKAFQYSNTLTLRNPVYRKVQATSMMTKFPIKGTLDIVIARYDPLNLDTNGIPERDASFDARGYQFSLSYNFVPEGGNRSQMRPELRIATMSDLMGQQTTDAEGDPAMTLSAKTSIAQVHLSGTSTRDLNYVNLTSILIAFPSNSEDAFNYYKTL